MPDTPERDPHRRHDFAGENVAEDQRDQARDRGAGLGAGSTENRDARYAEPGTPITDTTGLERDGNGEPLGGMTPEDDID